MKKLISAILIIFSCLGIYSCSKNDAASTATTTATTDNSTPSVYIYPYSTSIKYAYEAHIVVNTCYGTNSSGYTSAPFYSTSTHDLKARLPSSKWSNAVYSLQGHKISSSWENLWDGNIDMSLHEAEVIYDNESSIARGFWTGTKSDGTFRVRIVTTGQVHLLEIMPHMAHFKPRIVLIGSIIPPPIVAIKVVIIFCVSCITEIETNY